MSNTDKTLDELMNLDVQNVTEEKLRRLVEHLQDQMRNRYIYLVGEWRNARRAKSTRNGQFVSAQEVINYLTK